MEQLRNYAIHSIAVAYGLAFIPKYYSLIRMMLVIGGKLSFSMYLPSPPLSLLKLINQNRPIASVETLKSKVPTKGC